jgi:protein-tyrosine phosphatase
VARRLGGIDIAGLRARQVTADDFHRFDHIIAMDAQNLRNLQSLAPDGAAAKLGMLLDHHPSRRGQSVADPYYGDIADFEACWREVDAAACAIADQISTQIAR